MSGSLVLVATPIGNLGDITKRAIDLLQSADVVACEDTRQTGKLLNLLGIRAKALMAVHEHNEASSAGEIVDLVQSGRTVVLVTDAGLPGISDPGERVVAAVARAGLTVTAAPGPSAAITALVVSGLPAARFCFEGFLHRKGVERKRQLRSLATEERTSILYEAPQRLAATVGDLIEHCGGERRVVLARELTKLYEEVWRGSLADLLQRCQEGVKGECVLVLEGALPKAAPEDSEVRAEIEKMLEAGASVRDAVAAVSDGMGLQKNDVYSLATQVQKDRKTR